mgnify:CR=1 FL=1|tara:strand:- start:2363 stop:2779 length:417 start_codon:yes stop_codon:yes gene_type:complete
MELTNTTAELRAIEIKKDKKGNPAIQLVLATEENNYVREWINLSAPSFVWDRWGAALGISGDAESVKIFLTSVGTAYEIIGSQCKLQTFQEEFNGRMYTKVKDAKHITDESNFTVIEEVVAEQNLSGKVGVIDDDLPF